MGKVVGSANKESGTNSYAKNNQSAIKALKTVGKAIMKGTVPGLIVGSLVGKNKKTKRTDKFQEDKAKKQKEIEAVDV